MQDAEAVPQTDTLSLPDRLLNAAEQVVARDGVANLTLDAVAREAGVSKGGLLYHFSTKSALIIAIVERLATRCEANQALAVQRDSAEPGMFTRAYVHARNETLDPKKAPFQCALLAAAGTDPHYLEPFRSRISQWQDRLEKDGIDPAIATIVRLAIDGLAFGTMLSLPVPQGELRQRVIAALLNMTSQNTSAKD